MKEGPFNLRMQKSIKTLGIFCYKTADRFHPGVPDLYIAGGNWIESKVVRVGGQNRLIDLAGKMSEAQHNFANDLLRSGDRVIFAARVETPTSKHLLVVPYKMLMAQAWYVGDLTSFPEIRSEKMYDLEAYFNTDWPHHVNPSWYKGDSNG